MNVTWPRHAAVSYEAAAERTPWRRGGGEPGCAGLGASLLEPVQPHTLRTANIALEFTAGPPRLPQLPEKWVMGAPKRTTPFRQKKEGTPASHISDKFCDH